MNKLLVGSLLAASLAAWGQSPPAAMMDTFRGVAEALANRDADAFLDQFDPKMPQYEALRTEIQELFAASQEIGSTIDVITFDADKLELDWLLKIDNAEPRRRIVTCRVAMQGKRWKIDALEPLEFFKK